MAPQTTPPQGNDGAAPSRGRRLGSDLVLSGALVLATVAGSMWVTNSHSRAASATVSAPTTTVGREQLARFSPSVPAVTSGPRNLLRSADDSLDTSVTVYDDCSGQTELTHDTAAIDTCVGGRTYFVGHNAGVFTPLLDLGVGDLLTWYDAGGAAHRLRVVAVRDDWLRDTGVPPLATGAVVAQFQTCETAYPDGSHDRILDAVAA
jgi:hypothetical protein